MRGGGDLASRLLVFAIGNQLEAHQPIAAAQIQQAMREDRRAPGRVLHQLALCLRIDDLHPRDLFVLFWIDAHEQQVAVFAEAEEMTVDVQQRRAAQARFAPLHLAGGKFDAPQLGFLRVAAAGGVEVAVDVDRRVPVRLQRLVRGRCWASSQTTS